MALASALAMSGASALADELCRADAQFIGDYLRRNDAGVAAELERDGPARLALLDKQTLLDAVAAPDLASCARTLQTHLLQLRPGNLKLTWNPTFAANLGLLSGVANPQVPSPAVPIELARTKSGIQVLRLRSFAPELETTVHAVIARNGPIWRSQGRLLIDLRGNVGGVDRVWAPLRDWVLAQQAKQYGVRWWATPDNAQAVQNFVIETPGLSSEMVQAIQARATSLREATPSSWVNALEASQVAALTYTPPDQGEKAIGQVAILIDGSCAGSCEQLVLDLRQSPNVTIWGEHSQGLLDASNLAKVALPSGRSVLHYALSMTQRPPEQWVDRNGIKPQIDLSMVPSVQWQDRALACDLQLPCVPRGTAKPVTKTGKAGATKSKVSRKKTKSMSPSKSSSSAAGTKTKKKR